MQVQQVATNRQAALQLIRDVTAVPLSNNVILHDFAQNTLVTGREAVTAVLHTFFHTAFADLTIDCHTILDNEERVSLSLSLSGRQIAPFWGLPCTGRPIILTLTMICRFYASQVAYIELFYDAGTLLRQLGLAL